MGHDAEVDSPVDSRRSVSLRGRASCQGQRISMRTGERVPGGVRCTRDRFPRRCSCGSGGFRMRCRDLSSLLRSSRGCPVVMTRARGRFCVGSSLYRRSARVHSANRLARTLVPANRRRSVFFFIGRSHLWGLRRSPVRMVGDPHPTQPTNAFRSRENPGGTRLWLVRSHDRREDGQLRRQFHAKRWELHHAREGEPVSE